MKFLREKIVNCNTTNKNIMHILTRACTLKCLNKLVIIIIIKRMLLAFEHALLI